MSDALPDPAAAPRTRSRRAGPGGGCRRPAPGRARRWSGAAGGAPARATRGRRLLRPAGPRRAGRRPLRRGGRRARCRRPRLGLGRPAGAAEPPGHGVRARRRHGRDGPDRRPDDRTTRSCAGCPRRWRSRWSAAFLHQLLRRDGRPRLVESVASVITALALVVSGACLVPLPRTAEGAAVMAVAGAALGVCGARGPARPRAPAAPLAAAPGPGRRHGGGGRRGGRGRRRLRWARPPLLGLALRRGQRGAARGPRARCPR